MPIDAESLRPLAGGDAAALAAFYNGLTPASIRTFRPLGYATSLKICRKIVRGNLESPRKRYDLVGWRDTTIVGWAFIADLDKDQPYLGIAIADDTQGKGLGKTLIACVLGWARANGVEKVYLTVVTDNQRAINLYVKHGFETYDEKFNERDQVSYYHMVADLSAA